MELLVADDDPDARAMMQRGIEGGVLNVTVAASGAEAIELLSKFRFDILLSDIHMPPPGGIELAKMVRQNHPETDVIIMTGEPTMETVVAAIKAGVYDYLLKPLDLILLKAALRRCVERRALRAMLNLALRDAETLAASLRSLTDAARSQDALRPLADKAAEDILRLLTAIKRPVSGVGVPPPKSPHAGGA